MNGEGCLPQNLNETKVFMINFTVANISCLHIIACEELINFQCAKFMYMYMDKPFDLWMSDYILHLLSLILGILPAQSSICSLVPF